jgi:hypothetical protein
MARKGQPKKGEGRDPLGAEVVALLVHGRALIEKGHTRGVYARDRHGHPVALTSEKAVRFCAAGALVRAEVDLFDAEWAQGDVEDGVEGSQRLLLALSHLTVGCVAITLTRLLTGEADVSAVFAEKLVAGKTRQLIDRVNDASFVPKKHVLDWYDLALQLAATGNRKEDEA